MSAYEEKNTNPLVGMVAGAGTAGLGAWVLNDSLALGRRVDAWDTDAQRISNKIQERIAAEGPYTSPLTGQTLKVTPEEAESLLRSYHNGGHELTRNRFLGIRGKDWAKLRFLDKNFKIATRQARLWAAQKLGLFRHHENPLKYAIADLRGQLWDDWHHYDMFADPRTPAGMTGAHMLDVAQKNKLLDPDVKAGIEQLKQRAASGGPFSQDAYILASDKYDWKTKLKKLKELADTHGNTEILEKAERLLQGPNSMARPGIAEFTNGSFRTVGARDLYSRGIHKLVRGGKLVGKGLIAGGLTAGGLGLMDWLQKKSSTTDSNLSASDYLQAGASGAITLAGAGDLYTVLEDAIRAYKNKKAGGESLGTWLDAFINPNRTVGVTYGDWDSIGEGHASPGKNIAKILQQAVDKLSPGDENKDIVIKLLARGEQGLSRDMARKSHNMLYNTGLGLAQGATLGQDGSEVYDNALHGEAGRTQSLRNYLTDHATRDLYGGGGGGPTYDTEHVLGDKPKDMKLLTYGTDDLRDYPSRHLYKDVLHLGNNPGGSPLLDTDFMESVEQFDTREKMLAELDRYVSGELDGIPEVDRPKFKKVLDSVRAGTPLVTIAGSGRGDYVAERALAALSAADKHGLGMGKINIVPLFATHVDDAAEKAEKFNDTLRFREAFDALDPEGRIVSGGRVDRIPYTLLQRLADVNAASSGAMALAEAATGGGVNVLPRRWGDAGNGTNYRADVRNAITRAFTGKGDTHGIALDAWNGAAIDTMLDGDNTQPAHPSYRELPTTADADNLARQKRYFDSWIRTAPNELKLGERVVTPDELFDAFTSQKFNFDDIIGQLGDKDAMEAWRAASQASSKKNIEMVRDAHRIIGKDMLDTVRKNVSKQRWRAAGRLAAPLGLLGTGATMALPVLSNFLGSRGTAHNAETGPVKPKFEFKPVPNKVKLPVPSARPVAPAAPLSGHSPMDNVLKPIGGLFGN